MAKELERVLGEVYGDAGLELERTTDGDPRSALTLGFRASRAPSLETLLERVGAAAPAAPAAQAGSGRPWDIDVDELKRLRDAGADFVLVDVREQNEYDVCNLGGKLIPLGSLAERMNELDRGDHIVVHCKVGGRGAQAVAALREAGFDNAWNVAGGIFAWIDRIDPSLSKY